MIGMLPLAAWAASEPFMKTHCVWREEADADSGTTWHASCGEDLVWAFPETYDTPDLHGMKYCPYCSKQIVAKAAPTYLYTYSKGDYERPSYELEDLLVNMDYQLPLAVGQKYWRSQFIPMRIPGEKLAGKFCDLVDEIIADEIEDYDFDPGTIPEWRTRRLGEMLGKFVRDFWPMDRFLMPDPGSKEEEFEVTEEQVKEFSSGA